MAATKVYLAGVKKDHSSLLLPLPSAAILFVTQYCIRDTIDFHLTLVDEGIDPFVCVSVDQKILDKFHCEFTNTEGGYRNCALPVIVEEGGKLIRSGLCSIIRQIVSIAHKHSPAEDFQYLLGFRGGSLKACAEISGWTKLCEVELPDSISQLINCIRESVNADNAESQPIEVPEHVMKLERHLKKPAKLHNDDKHRRALLSDVRREAEKIDCVPKLSDFKFQRDYPKTHCVIRYNIKKSSSAPIENGNISGHQTSQICGETLLDTHQREHIDLIRMHDGNKKLCSLEELSSFLETLTFRDIDLVHQYSEGTTITVADLILFPFVYHLLESLSFRKESLTCHTPRIMSWTNHMVSLPRIQEAARNCGYRVDLFSLPSDGQKEVKLFVSAAVEEELKDYDLELTRRCRAKSRAIKPDVAVALEKIKEGEICVELGRHPCGDCVELHWDNLPDGVHPGMDLPKERLKRKCQQLENLVTAVQSMSRPGDVIVDFCSGGGHLGIVIAYLMPNCQVYLVENNESSLTRAKSRVEKANLTNVTLYQCNQDYFRGKFDVGTCLHACGSATDMVLRQCLENSARFVICPCCYGSIQNTHLMSYPTSQLFKRANIPSKDFVVLGHAADQTEFNRDLEEQGQHCMNLVDMDRASLAREEGYIVDLCSLKPPSCTPKNNLLIGRPSKAPYS